MSWPLGRNVWTQELLFALGGHNQSTGHMTGINRLGFKHCTDVSQKLCRKGKRWCLSNELCEINVLPLFQQSVGKVIITNNTNGKICWLSQFTCQRHNEWYLYPGTAWLSYPEVVLPKQAHDRQVTCAGSLRGRACIVSADNQNTSTQGYRAVSSATLISPHL